MADTVTISITEVAETVTINVSQYNVPLPATENDFLVAGPTLGWIAKTLAQVKAILGLSQGVQTATYANPTTTIDATTYKNWILTATGDTAIDMTNVTDGDAGTINIVIAGAGGYTITLGAMFTKKYGSTDLTVVTADDNLISWTKLGADILYTIIQKV